MIHWLTTAPNPRSPATGYDAGQRGWRLHAVEAAEDASFSSVRNIRSLCGLCPAHGWSLDLFIDRRCARCEVAAGFPLSEINRFSAELRAELRAGLHKKC